MASVYILYSPSLNGYYTGSCQELSERIEQHLNGTIPGAYTAKAKDWMLYFSIDDLTYKQARDIESHIKQMKSKTYIENLKKYPELSLKLRKQYA
jgi:putative endonuclease